MGNEPRIRRVEVTLWPGPEQTPATIRAFDSQHGQLPILLPPELEAELAQGVALSISPGIALTARRLALVDSLLGYVAGRLRTADGVLIHPDGEPVVSEGWIAAYNDLRPG